MARWGMVVDLGRCVGCHTCTIACKMENGLPPDILWRTVLDVETGQYPAVERTFVPLTCMHCADPPCHDACPTTATRVREDGIVWIRDDICIGCGSCVVACPYRARHLVAAERYYFGAPTEPELATYDRGRVGICTKCQFCFHKLDEAPAGAVPGEHPEYTPVCSSSCISDAIQFGDLDDPASRVAKLAAQSPQAARMLEQLETEPSVYYLNVPNMDAQPPRLQHSWHKRAVSNFFCGTTGAGLYFFAVLYGWLQGAAEPLAGEGSVLQSLRPDDMAVLLAPVLVAVGLLSVAAEAGRPLRGFNVLRNLRRSWMSRESGFAAVFIVLALLDGLFWRSPPLEAAAGLAGLGVALAQGLILARAKGVPAWNVGIMPAWFLSSALVCGGGVFLALSGLLGTPPPWLAAAGLVVLLLDLGVWTRYLLTPPKTATFTRSAALLRQRRYWWGIVGLGHLAPAALLAAGLAMPALAGPGAVLAGAAMVAGGLIAKYALILKAAFLVDLFDRFGEVRPGASAGEAASAAPPSTAVA